MKTDKKKFTFFALFTIIIIIVSVIISLVVQERIARTESISGIAATADSVWMIEGNRLIRYSHKGMLLSSFTFNNIFSSIYSGKSDIFAYSSRNQALYKIDHYGSVVFTAAIKEPVCLFVDDKGIYSISRGEKTCLLTGFNGKKIAEFQIQPKATGFVWYGKEVCVAYSGSNSILSLTGRVVATVDNLPQGYSILQGNLSQGDLFFLAAQQKGSDYYYARFFSYSLASKALKESNKRYITPVYMTSGKGYWFLASNLENSVDMYSLKGDYKGKFGDDDFLRDHAKMFLTRKRFIIIGVIMNTIVILSFIASIYIYFASRRLKIKGPSDV